MATHDVLVEAFKEGEKKLADVKADLGGNYQKGAYNTPLSRGNPVQTIGEYDPTTSPFITTAASSLNVDGSNLKPGQRLGHYGTTVYNPRRTDKEVEAVLGENRYNPAVEEKSPEQMRIQQAKLENEVRTLKSQMEVMVAALQTQSQAMAEKGETIQLPVIPVVKPYEEWQVHTLREAAKNRSLPYVGKNKLQLIEILRNADSSS